MVEHMSSGSISEVSTCVKISWEYGEHKSAMDVKTMWEDNISIDI